jgi:hypothetical protein
MSPKVGAMLNRSRKVNRTPPPRLAENVSIELSLPARTFVRKRLSVVTWPIPPSRTRFHPMPESPMGRGC